MQNDCLPFGLCKKGNRPRPVTGSHTSIRRFPPHLHQREAAGQSANPVNWWSGRQRECGTARFFECHCSAAVSASCRLSPDSFFPPPQGGQQILPNIHHDSPAPPAPTGLYGVLIGSPVRHRAYVIRRGRLRQDLRPGRREAHIVCHTALRLLSMRSGCRPFEPPPIPIGSISKALRLAGTAGRQSRRPGCVAVIKNRNSVHQGQTPPPTSSSLPPASPVLSASSARDLLCYALYRGTHTPVEPVTGLEPALPPWEGGVLTSGPYRHFLAPSF